MNTEEQRESVFDEMERLSSEYAQAKAEQVYLEEYRKTKIAILMKAAEVGNPGMSAVMQDREARRHPEYRELLEGLKAATEKAEHLRWLLKSKEMRFEHWRTKQANERAEKNLR